MHYQEICKLNLSEAFAVLSSTLSFFAPAALMVFLYTKLYLYARAHVRSIKMQLRAVTGSLRFVDCSLSPLRCAACCPNC